MRPEPMKGHEHFPGSFADGVSQRGIRGRISGGGPLDLQQLARRKSRRTGPGSALAGRVCVWRPGQNPDAPEFFVKGGQAAADPIHAAWLVSGVPAFTPACPRVPRCCEKRLAQYWGRFDAADPDLLASQMVGRWRSGAPIAKAPTADDLSIADGTLGVNDFEFGDDRRGLLCPWAAHIRKAYPRDDVRGNVAPDEATVNAAEAFTQTHRMLRRGITFGPELPRKRPCRNAPGMTAACCSYAM